MGVIIYGFNLNISPKVSCGVLECDIVMLQNYILMILYEKGGIICARPCVLDSLPWYVKKLPLLSIEYNMIKHELMPF